MASVLRCRWCPWSCPAVFTGTGGKIINGWRRLAAHVADDHEDVDFNAVAVVYGTTARGLDVVRRVEGDE
jgi:hypothetical protein